jgi:HSP20 family protein
MLPVRVERRRNVPSRWFDTFTDMDLVSNFDRLVDRVFGMREGQTEFYAADVWEDEGSVHVELELPGLKVEDVNISYEDGLLRIEGEKKALEHKGNVYLSERSYGKFIRTFQIPNIVDPNSIQATFRDGILEVTAQKKPETKPHKIEIKTSG